MSNGSNVFMDMTVVLVPRGETSLGDCLAEAAIMSLREDREVKFVHNGREYVLRRSTIIPALEKAGIQGGNHAK